MQFNKEQNAWAFYDWANSVYSLVIATAIFPIYFSSILKDYPTIEFLEYQIDKNAFFSYSISFSFLIVLLLSPFLSAISDRIGNKKLFLKIFCYIGSVACAGLFFFTSYETLWIGITCSILASVGFWGSMVFYNAYLPEIIDSSGQDQLSARGYSLGYIGSAILLVLCLGLIMGIDVSYTRYSFLLVGLWWAGFAQYTFANLPNSFSDVKEGIDSKYAYQELISVGKELFRSPNINFFLAGFFFYSIGIQTIIYMATIFGSQELKLPDDSLIITVLLIQFIAIAGAWSFSRISAKIGNIKALQIGVVVWGIITFVVYTLKAEDPMIQFKFYGLGALIGFVMGGVQSLSRSTYSKLIPQTGENTTYFSFYDVLEKIAVVIGMFFFGLLISLTGSMAVSVMSLAVFFVISIVLLFWVDMKKSR